MLYKSHKVVLFKILTFKIAYLFKLHLVSLHKNIFVLLMHTFYTIDHGRDSQEHPGSGPQAYQPGNGDGEVPSHV